jgi:membrane-associated phospholipid phosphatase
VVSGRPSTTRRRTAIGPVLRQLAQRFREGRAAIADTQWRAWQRTIALGAVAMFALMAGLRFAAGAALERGMLDWERDYLLRLGTSLRFSAAVFLQTFGSDITLVILILLTAGIATWMRRPISALSIVLAALVPDLVVRFGWMIWSRVRPDILYDGIASPGFHSFPSGHAAKTVAIYGFLALLWIRASRSTVEKMFAVVMLAFIAAVVPLGRMAMGVHWPSDIIAGVVLGLAWVAVLGIGLVRERRG